MYLKERDRHISSQLYSKKKVGYSKPGVLS